MVLDPRRTINGQYGQIFHDGEWLTNFNECEARVEQAKDEVRAAGTRWVGHKVIGLRGTGAIRGWKVTSNLIPQASSVADPRGVTYVTELIAKLDDPEAYGHERVRFKNVIFDEIPLQNFIAGEVVREEWPFTFEGYELLDPIVET